MSSTQARRPRAGGRAPSRIGSASAACRASGATASSRRWRARAGAASCAASTAACAAGSGGRCRGRSPARGRSPPTAGGWPSRTGAHGGAQPRDRAARSRAGLRRRPRDGGRLAGASSTAWSGSTGVPLLDRQRASTILNNGDEFYPSMLEAIRGARRSITIEAYIYWRGEIGLEFAQAIADRATAGVDGQAAARHGRLGDHRPRDPADPRGRRLPARLVQPDRLVHARPLQLPHPSQVAHRRRPHRASPAAPASPITGAGCAQDPEHWRDMQVRVEGHGAVPLQTGFAQNWLRTTGEMVSRPGVLPDADRRRPARRGPHRAQLARRPARRRCARSTTCRSPRRAGRS